MEEDFYILAQGILYYVNNVPVVDVVFLGKRKTDVSAHGLSTMNGMIKCYDSLAWREIVRRGNRVPKGLPLSQLRRHIGVLSNKRIYLLDQDNQRVYYSTSQMSEFHCYKGGYRL